MGSGVLLSQRAYAKRIGRSVGWVNKMVQSGVIELTGPKRKIDPVQADAALEAVKDPTRDAQREANDRRRKEKTIFDDDMRPKESIADMTPEERKARDEELRRHREELEKLREEIKAAGDDVEDVDLSILTLNEVKVAKEYYQGKLAELDYRKKRGDLIPKEVVEREAADVAMRVKSALLALPHKLSARIVGMETPEEIEAVLDAEIRHVLNELGETVA